LLSLFFCSLARGADFVDRVPLLIAPLPIVRQSRPIGRGEGSPFTLEGTQSHIRVFLKYVTTLRALIGFHEVLGGGSGKEGGAEEVDVDGDV
jgi:hypothetical protein